MECVAGVTVTGGTIKCRDGVVVVDGCDIDFELYDNSDVTIDWVGILKLICPDCDEHASGHTVMNCKIRWHVQEPKWNV